MIDKQTGLGILSKKIEAESLQNSKFENKIKFLIEPFLNINLS